MFALFPSTFPPEIFFPVHNSNFLPDRRWNLLNLVRFYVVMRTRTILFHLSFEMSNKHRVFHNCMSTRNFLVANPHLVEKFTKIVNQNGL